jgi:hypothetical protein
VWRGVCRWTLFSLDGQRIAGLAVASYWLQDSRSLRHVCNDCGRAFIDECSTGERYAVHVSIFKVHRLADEVTSRWLSETCPAQRIAGDEADRRTRFIPIAAVDVIPASPAATANTLNAVRKTEYVKGILGQNAPLQAQNANASSS